MTKTFREENFDQVLLLPASRQEFLPEEHGAQLIRD